MRFESLRKLGVAVACLVTALHANDLSARGEASIDADLGTAIELAAEQRREGNLRAALELLETACRDAGEACPARVRGELGATFVLAHRFQEGQIHLERAYATATSSAERALFANDLGNLNTARGRQSEAIPYYQEAEANGPITVRLSAALNLARIASPSSRRDLLIALAPEIAAVDDPRERARYRLNLGSQARTLGKSTARLAYENLEAARVWAAKVGDAWLLAQALDGLSQLYEDHGRANDALKLVNEGLAALRATDAGDIAIALHWRRGRLLQSGERSDLALQAYQAAVDQLQSVRQDIPIDYVEGRSSFRETLEPIYLGLAELLLKSAAAEAGDGRTQLLRRARDSVELLKQSELQDYLGDRCLLSNGSPSTNPGPPPRTAVLYPISFADRLALIVETGSGIDALYVNIASTTLREKALAFAHAIRDFDPELMRRSRELYDLLLRPIDDMLAAQQIDTLVVVPDASLRAIPIGALHDGKRFAIERVAITVTPGLGISQSTNPPDRVGSVLLAGLSQPGPVLEKMAASAIAQVYQDIGARALRMPHAAGNLTLPGVADEIEALVATTHGDRLLDSEFTVNGFREQLAAKSYQVVHIASHAVFSSRAEGGFILTYDDVLSMSQLQSMLRARSIDAQPLSLLSLSACQTAAGDDRAPLGIAGAALTARAASALGSLWPVDDAATKTLMVEFYTALTRGSTKAKALQQAQLALLSKPALAHPVFWAPFILVGAAR